MSGNAKDNEKSLEEVIKLVEELKFKNIKERVKLFAFYDSDINKSDIEMRPFFALKEYRDAVGKRGPNCPRPYKFPYFEEPSRETLASPYYFEFPDYIETIGYVKPRTVPQPSNPDQYAALLNSFLAFNKPPSKFYKTPSVQKALLLTMALFTADVSSDSGVFDFSKAGDHYMAPELDITKPAGLPFSIDSTMRLQATCIDRAFKLAEEIDAVLRARKVKDVQVPPCLLYNEGLTAPVTGVYPVAIELLEKRFSLMMVSTLSREDDFSRTPLNLGLMPKHIVGHVFPDITRGSNYGCTLRFTDLESSVHSDLIDFAFNIMFTWSMVESIENDPRANKHVWDFLKKYYKETPVLLPSGQLVCQRGGLTRGSDFSKFIGGIAITFVLVYSMLNQGVDPRLIQRHVYVRNSEAAFSVPRSFSTRQLVDDAKQLGYTIDESSILLSSHADGLRYCGITTKSDLRKYPDHEGPVWYIGRDGEPTTENPASWVPDFRYE